jgi:tetratricopeptide (TPR) repeat protein
VNSTNSVINYTLELFLPYEKSMNVRVLTLLIGSSLFAADEQRLALLQRAQADFDKVANSPSPQLHDTNVCVQTQAAMIPVATPEEAPIFHFRKGFCSLAAATITQEPSAFNQAASAFDQAVGAWQTRNAILVKRRPAEPVPSVFSVLASISRFKAGKGEVKPITDAVAAHVCVDTVLSAPRCEAVLYAGREWLGWSALLQNDVYAAAREFPASSKAWVNWVAAKRAFQYQLFAEAAPAFKRAVEAWDAASRIPSMPLFERLGPPVDLSFAYTEWAGAQLLTGDPAGALANLNTAVRKNGSNSRALFLRGRAHDALGHAEASVADYNLAARYALAKADEQGSGESHLYRGVSFYRRKDFERAEEEFTNALNFEVTPAVRADAVAWRRLSAVASGSCDAGRRYLEESLTAASPFFPRDEARATISACSATAQRSR